MNLHASNLRSLVPHAAFAAAPVAGLTFLLHLPLRHEASQLGSQLAILQQAIQNADPDALPPRELARRIDALGRGASSSPAIYDAITSAAARHIVRVDSISPSTLPTQEDEEAAPREAHAFSILAVGAFENLLPFLADIEQHCGFTSIRAVQIEPARLAAPGLLQVSIETIHTRYTLAAAPAEEVEP